MSAVCVELPCDVVIGFLHIILLELLAGVLLVLPDGEVVDSVNDAPVFGEVALRYY